MSAFMYITSDNDNTAQLEEVINLWVNILPSFDSSRKVNRTLYFPRWFILKTNCAVHLAGVFCRFEISR